MLALAGCGQPPSFELSWRIGDELDTAPQLTAVKQCADVGIFLVRVTISSGDQVVSVDQYPCFSIVEGPALEPGEYTVEVEGLRRNGEPWAFDPELDLEADRIAYASESVLVSEGLLPSIEVALRPPPECDDGIDNDRDGTVDGQDPGCGIAPITGAPSEFNDADVTLFQLAVSFLGSAAIKPANVGVHSIRLEVDGALLGQISSSQLDDMQWPFRLPLLARDLEGDTHTLEVTPMGADGPMAETRVFEFSTVDDQGTYVNEPFDFGSELFLQPIIEPLAFGFVPDCTPGGTLVLDSMRIRVLDENDTPVAVDLSGNTFVGGMVMPIIGEPQPEGWITFGCPSSNVRSNPLTWGHYRIEAQARRADISCFETPPVDLAPQPFSAQTIPLERVMVDGQPACPECSNSLDCAMTAGTTCIDGLCVPEDGP